jgi:phage baseplate assembly protein W
MIKKPVSKLNNKATNKDFDLAFRKHPTTGKLIIKKDDEAIKQAVKNLVLTNHYEKPFHPEFGGNVRAFLFENFNSITKSEFETMVNIAIGNYETRIQLQSEEGKPSVTVKEEPDENSLMVSIRFRNVTTLNDVTLDVNLNRIR